MPSSSSTLPRHTWYTLPPRLCTLPPKSSISGYCASRRNLEAVDYKVDYVLTHDAPSRFLDFTALASGESNQLHSFLDKILLKLTYDKWFFGCYHKDTQLFPFQFQHAAAAHMVHIAAQCLHLAAKAFLGGILLQKIIVFEQQATRHKHRAPGKNEITAEDCILYNNRFGGV